MQKPQVDIHQLTSSIKNEQTLIQENQKERNEKYRTCIQTFADHLKHEIQQIQQSARASEKRNKDYQESFEAVYNRIMTGAEGTIRKMKNTFIQKKNLWKKIVEEYSEISNLELKARFYQELTDKEYKYYEAIDAQKLPTTPYSALIGESVSNQSLLIQQKKNKILEDRVTQKETAWLTATALNFRETAPALSRPPLPPAKNMEDSGMNDQVIDRFMKRTGQGYYQQRKPQQQNSNFIQSRPRSRAGEDIILDQFIKE